jgi:hypothetical protein
LLPFLVARNIDISLTYHIQSGVLTGMSEPTHWITTHWPPLTDRPHLQNVYLQDEHRDACPIKPGDFVVVYEYKTGPTLVDRETGQRIKREPGREGVVLAAKVKVSSVAVRPNWRCRSTKSGRG